MESRMHCEILEDWDDILFTFQKEKRDVYFTKKYLSLYESSYEKALCVVCREADRIMLMPFLRGKVGSHYDFETAYGYGGPISNTDDLEWCYRAFDAIYEFLRENDYVCGFIRFHPLFNNEMLVREEYVQTKKNIQILYDRQTIAIDTTQSEEEIWTKQINSKNRNMIRKAEKNSLEYKTEYDYASYDEFIALYRATMLRLSADEFYFFDDEYFHNLRQKLSECSFLGTVRKDGKMICAAVFMYSKLYGHYHLEGSDRVYSSLGANNFLLWKAAIEMHTLGVHEFHLGGGTSSSQDDSLYKFKKAFSRNEKQFNIGKIIFDRNSYDSIVKEWELANQEKISKYGQYLLKYRY